MSRSGIMKRMAATLKRVSSYLDPNLQIPKISPPMNPMRVMMPPMNARATPAKNSPKPESDGAVTGLPGLLLLNDRIEEGRETRNFDDHAYDEDRQCNHQEQSQGGRSLEAGAIYRCQGLEGAAELEEGEDFNYERDHPRNGDVSQEIWARGKGGRRGSDCSGICDEQVPERVEKETRRKTHDERCENDYRENSELAHSFRICLSKSRRSVGRSVVTGGGLTPPWVIVLSGSFFPHAGQYKTSSSTL